MRRVWVGKDSGALHDIYTPDAKIEGILPETVLDLSEYVDVVTQFNHMVDVTDWNIERDFTDGGDLYYVRLRVQLTSHVTDTSGFFKMTCELQMQGDRPKYAFILLDALSFMEKAGVVPQGALYIALAGGQLA